MVFAVATGYVLYHSTRGLTNIRAKITCKSCLDGDTTEGTAYVVPVSDKFHCVREATATAWSARVHQEPSEGRADLVVDGNNSYMLHVQAQRIPRQCLYHHIVATQASSALRKSEKVAARQRLQEEVGVHDVYM